MRQQGLDALRVGHRRQGLEQVVQIGARLQPRGLRRLHQGVQHRTGLGTARAAREQPRLRRFGTPTFLCGDEITAAGIQLYASGDPCEI